MKQGVAAAFTAFCSKHSTAGFSSPIILRRVAGAAAVVAPAPATLRPCYSASADSDIVELQLKVGIDFCSFLFINDSTAPTVSRSLTHTLHHTL